MISKCDEQYDIISYPFDGFVQPIGELAWSKIP